MNIFKIIKKELDKIFKFPRQIFTTLILPGFILFVIYAFIGTGIEKMMKEEENKDSIIHVINAPESLDVVFPLAKDENVNLIESSASELENLKQLILDGQIQAILLYDENFDANINKDPLATVKILYDSSNTNALVVFERAQKVVSIQQGYLYQKLEINPHIFNVEQIYVQPEEKGTAVMLAMILPMILMSFIFANALAIGSDAIAGEKERGTLATLLMLPIKRSEIIIGKIISTSTITVLSAFSSFLGLVLSLPFAKSMFAIEGAISYGVLDIVGLVVILLLIALLASTILLIISTIAKNIKEATTLAMPIYIAAIIIPIITMFSTGSGSISKGMYLIPIYNTILGLKEILSFNFDLVNFLLILGSSIIYIVLFVVILVRMFKSERVLYSK